MKKGFTASIVLTIIVLLSGSCGAQQISDPENVSTMQVSVMQSGSITLSSTGSFSAAEGLNLRLYVPQNDSRQTSTVKEVIGPDSHEYVQDDYGNTQIVMVWENPPIDREIDYAIETEVETRTRSSGEDRDFPITGYIKPDKGIIEAAYAVAAGRKSVENMFRIGTWVNDNVVYDLSCEKQAYPATWVFERRIGTCDEFSVLALSMLRTLGYDAWYVAGYAYLGGKQEGGKSFGSHAWVEARIGGRTYDMDPTWAEAPVDATHLVFARLPDANFTEHTGVKSRDVSISWDKDETRIMLEDFSEEPRMGIELQAIPESVEGGKSVILKASTESDGCVMTNLRAASCINEDGSDIFKIDEKSRPVFFCEEDEFHWLAESQRVKAGLKYTCPVNVAGGGMRASLPITVTSEFLGDVDISITTNILLDPEQEFTATAAFSNEGLSSDVVRVFAILEDEMSEDIISLSRRERKNVDFGLKAPKAPGEYALTVFSESGDTATETVEVLSERDILIKSIEYPETMQEGQECSINVTVTSSESSGATLSYSTPTREEESTLQISPGEDSRETLNCSGESPGEANVVISLLGEGGSYQDSWTGTIEVTSKPDMKEDFSNALEDFIAWLIETIRSALGL